MRSHPLQWFQAGFLFVWMILMGSLICVAAERPPGPPYQFNSAQDGDTIVLGRIPNHPYIVLIPGDSPTQLQNLRRYIQDALIMTSRLGPYIQVGAFQERQPAEQVSRWLEELGFNTRVVLWR
jgi:hypothetical protein